VLNGSKAWITNIVEGKVFVAIAVTDPEAGTRGTSAFIVTPDLPGFHFGHPEKKMGLKSSITGGITFEECVVPGDRLLGREGMGLKVALGTLDASRIGIAAQAVGIARGAFEEALNYASTRRTFGKALYEHGAIQAMIADMGTQIEAARLLAYHAAAARDSGSPDLGRLSSMAKLYASETAKMVCDLAVQIHGAYGYSREYPVERFYRDVRVTTIYEGTSEIQRMVIARSLLKE
jgi:alkylation response protein AidB-like acyl-CoA dehydrogenase